VLFYVALVQNTGGDCRRVTPVYTVSAKFRELQRWGRNLHRGDSGVYVRLRCVYVRIHGLENRQGFTAFVSSNLTLSAKLNKTASDEVLPVRSVRCRAWETHEVCGVIYHGFHTGHV
jgi:hypothetical protein